MKQSISQVKRSYKRHYRLLRLNGGTYQDEDYPFGLNEIQDCAILSYDYHDSYFDGWLNRTRMYRFIERSRGNKHSVYGIPF
jgi:hypothetical protein